MAKEKSPEEIAAAAERKKIQSEKKQLKNQQKQHKVWQKAFHNL